MECLWLELLVTVGVHSSTCGCGVRSCGCDRVVIGVPSGPVIAVVVCYDPGDHLSRCLDAIRAAGGIDHVVLVDTGGLVGEPNREEVTVVRRVDNPGFGGAANAGFAEARRRGASLIALLNDDVVVTHGWLEPIQAAFDHGVGAVQPALVCSGADVVNSTGVTIAPNGGGHDRDDGEPVSVLDGSVRPAELFTGGAVVLDPDFLAATGGFDERYFLYYEDVDLARRGAALGWTFRCATGSIVFHEAGTSTSSLGAELRFLQERNRLWNAFRNEPPSTIGRAVWLSVRRLRYPPVSAHVRALLAGVAGAPRRVWERVRA